MPLGLRELPPLVFGGETRTLLGELGGVIAGRAFLLQAGDCAESFTDLTTAAVHNRLRVILQIAIVLTYGSGSLDLRYATTCDPRLNARQSLDLAFRVAEMLSARG